MCLLVFAWRPDTAAPLVLAGNRDEFHERPAAPADWWDDDILGGRDLRAGGTWLAARRDGRFAVVTNFREPLLEGRGPRSRGELVTHYLQGDAGAETFAREVAARGHEYAGFNLLLGDPRSLYYLSNRGAGPEPVAPGIHGLSNHLLDTAWPKVERSRGRFAAALAEDAGTEALMELLADRLPASDEELPDTGLEPEWERLLSAPFIVHPHYGTRCSTVLRVATDRLELTERRYDAAGERTGESAFGFALAGAGR